MLIFLCLLTYDSYCLGSFVAALQSDDIYLEVQIQNTTHGQPIYLEKVILEPTKTLSGKVHRDVIPCRLFLPLVLLQL